MEAHRPHYNLTFAILAIAGIAFALLQSLVAPALRTIQTDLHTTTTAVAWVFTGYLLAASVATPIVGRLGDMFGKKRMLVVRVAVGAGIAAQLVIPESPIRAPGRIDWVGAGLLTGWLVALLVGVSEAPAWGWGSARVLGLFGVAAALFALWVRFEDRVEGPLVDM